MKEVNLDKLKAVIPELEFSLLHKQDVMFRLSHSAGYAKALWNFIVAMMDAEADNFEAIYDVAGTSHDLTHLCGFHKLRFSSSRWEQIRWFLTRVWQNKAILNLKPELKDYIEFVCENSRVRWGNVTRPMGLMFLNEAAENPRLPWRTSEWLNARYRTAHPPLLPINCGFCCAVFVPRQSRQKHCSGNCAYGAYRVAHPPRPRPPRQLRTKLEPMAEFWPYLSAQPTEDHDLLVSVDQIVPRSLSDQVRADICQDMIVAILTGETTLDNLRDAAPKYIKWFFKQEPSKYGHLSLDLPIFDGGAATLGSQIEAEFA